MRAHRSLKRKFPYTPFPTSPQPAQPFTNQLFHTNTKEFLQVRLLFFPQNTYFHSNPNNEQPNCVNEHVLYPTLSWTSFYHFTNPLSLPLYNIPGDNELCHTLLYHLTTALTEKQFTNIGYNQTLTRFTAPKANRFSIGHYDHSITRANEDTFLDDGINTNPQLTEKFFIKSRYVFTLNSMIKKFDQVN